MISNSTHCMVLGANGQVGSALVRALESKGAKVTTVTRDDLDATSKTSIESFITQINTQTTINYLFNAIAYTAVDKAEQEPELADALNHKLPATLASLSQKLGFTLVHYSTDYVYPGNGDTAYTEESPTEPLSVYGKTKLLGDQAVLAQANTQASTQANTRASSQTCSEQARNAAQAPSALIARTSWVYAKQGNNFVNTMLRLAKTKSELSVVNDQIGAPTSARFIADTTLKLLAAKQHGVFHVVPAGHTSWADFAREIFHLKQKNVTVHGIHSHDYPTPAKRPLNSRLSIEKLEHALSETMPDWRAVLEQELALS